MSSIEIVGKEDKKIIEQKVCILGDVEVGKSCIVNSCLNLKFTHCYDKTIGAFFANLKFKQGNT